MAGDGIADGDLLVIDRSVMARPGMVVVATHAGGLHSCGACAAAAPALVGGQRRQQPIASTLARRLYGTAIQRRALGCRHPCCAPSDPHEFVKAMEYNHRGRRRACLMQATNEFDLSRGSFRRLVSSTELRGHQQTSTAQFLPELSCQIVLARISASPGPMDSPQKSQTTEADGEADEDLETESEHGVTVRGSSIVERLGTSATGVSRHAGGR